MTKNKIILICIAVLALLALIMVCISAVTAEVMGEKDGANIFDFLEDGKSMKEAGVKAASWAGVFGLFVLIVGVVTIAAAVLSIFKPDLIITVKISALVLALVSILYMVFAIITKSQMEDMGGGLLSGLISYKLGAGAILVPIFGVLAGAGAVIVKKD